VWCDGKLHGRGKVIYDGDDIYEGAFGVGFCLLADGSSYEGEF
jgi:hypothetical protein